MAHRPTPPDPQRPCTYAASYATWVVAEDARRYYGLYAIRLQNLARPRHFAPTAV